MVNAVHRAPVEGSDDVEVAVVGQNPEPVIVDRREVDEILDGPRKRVVSSHDDLGIGPGRIRRNDEFRTCDLVQTLTEFQSGVFDDLALVRAVIDDEHRRAAVGQRQPFRRLRRFG